MSLAWANSWPVILYINEASIVGLWGIGMLHLSGMHVWRQWNVASRAQTLSDTFSVSCLFKYPPSHPSTHRNCCNYIFITPWMYLWTATILMQGIWIREAVDVIEIFHTWMGTKHEQEWWRWASHCVGSTQKHSRILDFWVLFTSCIIIFTFPGYASHHDSAHRSSLCKVEGGIWVLDVTLSWFLHMCHVFCVCLASPIQHHIL